MAKLISALAVCGLLLVWSLISPSRRTPSRASIPEIPRVLKEGPATITTTENGLASIDYLVLVASLPMDREGLSEQSETWCRLEEGLLARQPEVLEKLLARYEGEVEPAYKGLLAVLLSAEVKTHRRLLDDHLSRQKEGWDLFHGMALLALVRNRPEDPLAALAPDRVEWWKRLFRFVDLGVIEHEGDVETRTTGVYEKRMACSASMKQLEDMFDLVRECPPTDNPQIRAALMDAFLGKWDWKFPYWLSRGVMGTSAEADRSLARTLAETYLGSQSEEMAEKGFDLLRYAVLPDDSFPHLEKWARTATGRGQLEDAIYMLGVQKHAPAERMLTELYVKTSDREEIRENLLEAMAAHGAPSFQAIAEVELRGGQPNARIAALQVLSRMPSEESLRLIIETAKTDKQSRIRYAALRALRDRNVWGREEEKVLSFLRSDRNPKIRHFANGLQTAQDRSAVRTESLSGWEWPRPGEEEPTSSD